MVDARKEFYARAEVEADRGTEKTLNMGKFIAKVLVPVGILLFTAMYWCYGMYHYMQY